MKGVRDPRVGGLRWEPLPYMKRMVKFLLTHASAALFVDPG